MRVDSSQTTWLVSNSVSGCRHVHQTLQWAPELLREQSCLLHCSLSTPQTSDNTQSSDDCCRGVSGTKRLDAVVDRVVECCGLNYLQLHVTEKRSPWWTWGDSTWPPGVDGEVVEASLDDRRCTCSARLIHHRRCFLSVGISLKKSSYTDAHWHGLCTLTRVIIRDSHCVQLNPMQLTPVTAVFIASATCWCPS